MHLTRKGFTIIELLVVISIIALLVVIGLVAYGQVGPKARDSKRKEDLRSISQALEIYYQNYKRYPRTGFAYSTANLSTSITWITDDGTSTSPVPLGSNFIQGIPVDSKSNGGNAITDTSINPALGYTYWSGSVTGAGCPVDATGGQYFILAATLENQNDSERNAVKNYKRCDGASITNNNFAFVVTSPQ